MRMTARCDLTHYACRIDIIALLILHMSHLYVYEWYAVYYLPSQAACDVHAGLDATDTRAHEINSNAHDDYINTKVCPMRSTIKVYNHIWHGILVYCCSLFTSYLYLNDSRVYKLQRYQCIAYLHNTSPLMFRRATQRMITIPFEGCVSCVIGCHTIGSDTIHDAWHTNFNTL